MKRGLRAWVWGWLICAGVARGGELTQDAYVWQRAWTPGAREAVAAHGDAFRELAVLAEEISWKGSRPLETRVALPYELLRGSKAKFGLALRIGSFGGPFSETDQRAMALGNIAATLVDEARTNGLAAAELQIDFDCAESKLEGYGKWIRAIKKAVGTTPVAITALPSWLRQPAFGELAATAGQYILQVHSLERPESYDATFTLCNPDAARAAVLKAEAIGIPFRVALPTYGYLLAFAADGRFVWLSAEGPAKSWPADAKLREVESDPVALSALAREWAEKRPALMRGIIWYRFPTQNDNLNWRWPTLDAIMQMRRPQERFRAETRRVEAGLYEISLVNEGELDISSRLAVDVQWQGARLLAGDGVRGFELTERQISVAKLQSQNPARLRAGDHWTIGWIRLTQDAEVKVESEKE